MLAMVRRDVAEGAEVENRELVRGRAVAVDVHWAAGACFWASTMMA